MNKYLTGLLAAVAVVALVVTAGLPALSGSLNAQEDDTRTCADPTLSVAYTATGARINWAWSDTGNSGETSPDMRVGGTTDMLPFSDGGIDYALGDLPVTVEITASCRDGVLVSAPVEATATEAGYVDARAAAAAATALTSAQALYDDLAARITGVNGLLLTTATALQDRLDAVEDPHTHEFAATDHDHPHIGPGFCVHGSRQLGDHPLAHNTLYGYLDSDGDPMFVASPNNGGEPIWCTGWDEPFYLNDVATPAEIHACLAEMPDHIATWAAANHADGFCYAQPLYSPAVGYVPAGDHHRWELVELPPAPPPPADDPDDTTTT